MADGMISDADWLAYKRSLEARRFFGTVQLSVQAGQMMDVKETRTLKPHELKECDR